MKFTPNFMFHTRTPFFFLSFCVVSFNITIFFMLSVAVGMMIILPFSCFFFYVSGPTLFCKVSRVIRLDVFHHTKKKIIIFFFLSGRNPCT